MSYIPQTEEDTIAELETLTRLAKVTGRRFICTWINCEIDAFILDDDGNLTSVVEVRNRKEHYPRCRIDCHKIEKLRRWSDFFGVPAILLFADPAGAWAVQVPVSEHAFQAMLEKWKPSVLPIHGRVPELGSNPAYEIEWSDLKQIWDAERFKHSEEET